MGVYKISRYVYWGILTFIFVLLSFSITYAQYENRRKRARSFPKPTPQQSTKITDTTPLIAQAITGKVFDETGTALPGAVVRYKDALQGTLTNEKGVFKLEAKNIGKATIIIEFLGYEPQEISLNLPQNTPLSVSLIESGVVTKEVVVISASRRSESQFTTPVSVYKIDGLNVRENPMLSVYQGAGYQPGVQVLNSSFLLNSINVRGFGQGMNSRILSLNDGVDLQSPIIGTPIGIMNGASDLDVASAEIIAGPASALYGPNAFNGVFNVVSKDPFQYPGLTVSLKTGFFHINEPNISAKPFIDAGFRYAKVINSKFAFKVNGTLLMGDDWRGTDTRDGADYPANSRYTEQSPLNPGYDGVNLHGDELAFTFDSTNTQTPLGPLVRTPVRVARTGYPENQLTNYETRVFRIDASAHYRMTSKHELVAGIRYSRAEGMLQRHATRFWLDGGMHIIGRLELKHPKYFVRGYILRELLPSWYSLSNSGANVQGLAKAPTNWYAQFALAYNPENAFINQVLNGILTQVGRQPIAMGDPQAARAFADADNRALYPYLYQALRFGGLDSLTAVQQAHLWSQGLQRPEYGTPLFDSLFHRTTKVLYQNEPYGSLTSLQTGMYHLEGQYTFDNLLDNFNLYVGASTRVLAGMSDNRFYYEANGKGRYAQEMGAYAQGIWQLIDKRLLLTTSIRFDKNIYSNLQFSPRLALSFALGNERNHVIRAAFNSGFRPPTLEQLFLRIETPIGIVTGGNKDVLELYNLMEGRAFMYADYQKYKEARLNGVAQEDAAPILKAQFLKTLQPEIARSFEVGYRFHFNDKFIFDGYGYATYNYNLMAVSTIIGPAPKSNLKTFGTAEIDANLYTPYTIYQNNDQVILTYGAAGQASYNFNTKFSITTSYGYNAVRSDSALRALINVNFSSPEHIGRIIFTGRNIAKKFGFLCAYNIATSFSSILGSSRLIELPVRGYNTVDLQVNYKVSALKTNIKLGGTNIFNNRHTEIIAGGTIGALFYLQLNFDNLLN